MAEIKFEERICPRFGSPVRVPAGIVSRSSIRLCPTGDSDFAVWVLSKWRRMRPRRQWRVRHPRHASGCCNYVRNAGMKSKCSFRLRSIAACSSPSSTSWRKPASGKPSNGNSDESEERGDNPCLIFSVPAIVRVPKWMAFGDRMIAADRMRFVAGDYINALFEQAESFTTMKPWKEENRLNVCGMAANHFKVDCSPERFIVIETIQQGFSTRIDRNEMFPRFRAKRVAVQTWY